jgi:hypothetical protein
MTHNIKSLGKVQKNDINHQTCINQIKSSVGVVGGSVASRGDAGGVGGRGGLVDGLDPVAGC